MKRACNGARIHRPSTARGLENTWHLRKGNSMPAYFIVDLEVTDPAGFEEYRQLVPATIQQYGGRYVVRGGATETLEGDWQPKRVVVLEFPSLEQAKRWYNSEEYRGPKALRLKTAKSKMILVEGA
jgi:uncharacterized protein (DUF1330 family)